MAADTHDPLAVARALIAAGNPGPRGGVAQISFWSLDKLAAAWALATAEVARAEADQEYAANRAATLAAGAAPCEGCGKPGVVIDADGCDLCQDCADGCWAFSGLEGAP